MVTLTIGGAARDLVYDCNAMCRLRQEHGINLLQPDALQVDDPVVLRALLWAAFLHAEPRLTVETVGGWVRMANFGEALRAVLRALQDDMAPQSEAGRAAADPPPAEGSSGTTSSALVTASAS